MAFSLTEKLAVVKAIDQVVIADGKVADGEIKYLNQLMEELEFDKKFIQEARRIKPEESTHILMNMSDAKKKILAGMLYKMSKADGVVRSEELSVIHSIATKAGIDIEEFEKKKTDIDLTDIYFLSSDHLRYENKLNVSHTHDGAKRAIKIESNILGPEGYSVTIFNLEGINPLWGNNVQLTAKPMKVVETSGNVTKLRGFGKDSFGNPYTDFGLSVYHEESKIEKIVLHMHDRHVDIEYLE